MSHYWAKFLFVNGETFRIDTRIYLKDINDPCVGAIIGKNPGSAKPFGLSGQLQPINLDNDKLLPTVRNIIKKAYLVAQVPLPDRGFIQVLNLFYLCNKTVFDAIAAIKKVAEPPRCNSECGVFPWAWYVWGGSSDLKSFKKHFPKINANYHFYFDNSDKKVKDWMPNCYEFARHTQGLKQEYVIPHIAKIIANGFVQPKSQA